MNFECEKHQKLWYLLANEIAEAAKMNYQGNGYYSGYSAVERLKRKLLTEYFDEEDRQLQNLCFACETAYEEQQNDWYERDSINCDFCPLKWPDARKCDDNHSLYMKLIDCLEADDIDTASDICVMIANVKPYTAEEYDKEVGRLQPCYRYLKIC